MYLLDEALHNPRAPPPPNPKSSYHYSISEQYADMTEDVWRTESKHHHPIMHSISLKSAERETLLEQNIHQDQMSLSLDGEDDQMSIATPVVPEKGDTYDISRRRHSISMDDRQNSSDPVMEALETARSNISRQSNASMAVSMADSEQRASVQFKKDPYVAIGRNNFHLWQASMLHRSYNSVKGDDDYSLASRTGSLDGNDKKSPQEDQLDIKSKFVQPIIEETSTETVNPFTEVSNNAGESEGPRKQREIIEITKGEKHPNLTVLLGNTISVEQPVSLSTAGAAEEGAEEDFSDNVKRDRRDVIKPTKAVRFPESSGELSTKGSPAARNRQAFVVASSKPQRLSTLSLSPRQNFNSVEPLMVVDETEKEEKEENREVHEIEAKPVCTEEMTDFDGVNKNTQKFIESKTNESLEVAVDIPTTDIISKVENSDFRPKAIITTLSLPLIESPKVTNAATNQRLAYSDSLAMDDEDDDFVYSMVESRSEVINPMSRSIDDDTISINPKVYDLENTYSSILEPPTADEQAERITKQNSNAPGTNNSQRKNSGDDDLIAVSLNGKWILLPKSSNGSSANAAAAHISIFEDHLKASVASKSGLLRASQTGPRSPLSSAFGSSVQSPRSPIVGKVSKTEHLVDNSSKILVAGKKMTRTESDAGTVRIEEEKKQMPSIGFKEDQNSAAEDLGKTIPATENDKNYR